MARKSRKHINDDTAFAEITSTSICYNAAAYVRLSKDDTKKRGDSIENQRNIIENYVAINSDIFIKEVYVDNDQTGINFERPAFQRMLADVHNGKINCIIVKDLSRFGRNAIDGGYYLEKLLPELKIRFIAITDQYDSNNPENTLLLPLMNIINESYSLDISRKMKAVNQQNINDGRFIGRIAPYGYMKAPDDCHKLMPDPESAPVVKQIYKWALENVSNTEIARRLSSKKIMTPAYFNFYKGYEKKDKSFSPYWQSARVAIILSERVYVGDMVQGKSKTARGKTVLTDPSEWICVPNTHEPIITHEMFDEVQHMRKDKQKRDKAYKKNVKPYTPNIFKGKVFCYHCGYHMRRSREKSEIYKFRCDSKAIYGNNACIAVSVLETDVIDNIIKTIFKDSKMIHGRYSDLIEKSVHSNNAENDIEMKIKDVERELNNKSRYLKGLYENMINELITPDEFAQMKSDYEKDIEELYEKANVLRSIKFKLSEEKATYGGYSETVSNVLRKKRLSNDVINSLIDKIIVKQDKSFEVIYYYNEEREVS